MHCAAQCRSSWCLTNESCSQLAISNFQNLFFSLPLHCFHRRVLIQKEKTSLLPILCSQIFSQTVVVPGTAKLGNTNPRMPSINNTINGLLCTQLNIDIIQILVIKVIDGIVGLAFPFFFAVPGTTTVWENIVNKKIN